MIDQKVAAQVISNKDRANFFSLPLQHG